MADLGLIGPPPTKLSLREHFLQAWEQTLGAIVDEITGSLADTPPA